MLRTTTTNNNNNNSNNNNDSNNNNNNNDNATANITTYNDIYSNMFTTSNIDSTLKLCKEHGQITCPAPAEHL